MKIYLLFTFFILGVVSKCFAEKVGGQIFWNRDSSTYATFIIPGNSEFKGKNLDEIQNEIKYYDSGSNEKKTLLPEHAKEIRFYYRGDSVRMISCLNTLNLRAPSSGTFGFKNTSPYIFLRINIDGRVKLYTFYNRASGGGNPYYGSYGSINIVSEKPIMQKENGEFFRPRQVGFKKIMKKHLSDCKEVIAKIIMEEYTYANIDTIIREYNNCVK